MLSSGNQKRIHSVCLHLYEVQEQANSLMVIEYCLLVMEGWYQLERNLGELSGEKEMWLCRYIKLKVMKLILKLYAFTLC